MTDLWDNPMGTDGFEFVEYAALDPKALGSLFETMGFRAVAKHRHKDVTLFRQGDVNFIINGEPGSFGQSFARIHGPCVCAIAFRVKDAAAAYKRAVGLGAWGVEPHPGPMELAIPAIKGIGDSLIYLIDRYPEKDAGHSIYDVDFRFFPGVDPRPAGVGLTHVDHLTHNVHRGRMKEWAGFYERLFNFREVRYFDIEGKLTGLRSKAMTSPCGKIRIPINESADESSQIQEYLDAYRGEGIQHIALSTDDIYETVEALGRQQRGFSRHARYVLRDGGPAPSRARRGPGAAAAQPNPDRRQPRWRSAAADLHQDGDRADLLRDHPAQGRRGLRRR